MTEESKCKAVFSGAMSSNAVAMHGWRGNGLARCSDAKALHGWHGNGLARKRFDEQRQREDGRSKGKALIRHAKHGSGTAMLGDELNKIAKERRRYATQRNR